jgi:hypothetical protein
MIAINEEKDISDRLVIHFYANEAYNGNPVDFKFYWSVRNNIDDSIYIQEDYLAHCIYTHMRLGFIEDER